jgi:hypothetical protein
LQQIVIPAQAGIHYFTMNLNTMDPRLRGEDGLK